MKTIIKTTAIGTSDQLPTALIQPAPVDRSGELGQWHHPELPDFDEGDEERFKAWLRQQQLELRHIWLQDDDSPQAQHYWDGNDPDLTFWTPQPPDGEGWFLLWLCDTEDGGCATFARRQTETPNQ